jgi:hypothetical protein
VTRSHPASRLDLLRAIVRLLRQHSCRHIWREQEDVDYDARSVIYYTVCSRCGALRDTV